MVFRPVDFVTLNMLRDITKTCGRTFIKQNEVGRASVQEGLGWPNGSQLVKPCQRHSASFKPSEYGVSSLFPSRYKWRYRRPPCALTFKITQRSTVHGDFHKFLSLQVSCMPFWAPSTENHIWERQLQKAPSPGLLVKRIPTIALSDLPAKACCALMVPISGRQTQNLYTYGHPFQDMQSIKPLSIPLIKGLLQDLVSSRLMMQHYWSGFRKRVWNFQLSRIDVGLQTGQQRSVQSVYSVYSINLRIF